jgi:Hemerythrin HHE cation binding domain
MLNFRGLLDEKLGIHARLRRDLRGIRGAMAEKVEKVHASKPTCPRDLATHLHTIYSAILDHLAKEEQVLFSMIRGGYRDQACAPIRVMEQGHEDHWRNLESLRALMNPSTSKTMCFFHGCYVGNASYRRKYYLTRPKVAGFYLKGESQKMTLSKVLQHARFAEKLMFHAITKQ